MAEKKETVSQILKRLENMPPEPPGKFSQDFIRWQTEEAAERTRKEKESEIRRHAEILVEVDLEKERRLMAMRSETAEPRAKKVWRGKQRAFGDHVLKRRGKEIAAGKITRHEALSEACRGYVSEDPRTGERKAMNPKSIMNSLYARDHVEKK